MPPPFSHPRDGWVSYYSSQNTEVHRYRWSGVYPGCYDGNYGDYCHVSQQCHLDSGAHSTSNAGRHGNVCSLYPSWSMPSLHSHWHSPNKVTIILLLLETRIVRWKQKEYYDYQSHTYISGFMQNCSICRALALKIPQSFMKPLISQGWF